MSVSLYVSAAEIGDQNFAEHHPHLYRRILKHYFKYHLDSKLPYERLVALSEYRTLRAHDHKDKMNAQNLVHLTPEKRWKLARMLRQKGRFIQISRNMLEGTIKILSSFSIVLLHLSSLINFIRLPFEVCVSFA